MSDRHATPGDPVLADEAYPDDSSPFEPSPERPLRRRAVPLLRQLAIAPRVVGGRHGSARIASIPTVHAPAISRIGDGGHNADDPEPV